MLESFIKMNYQCENLAVHLCASTSNTFFHYLSSFITVFSQNNKEGFNINNESKLSFFFFN